MELCVGDCACAAGRARSASWKPIERTGDVGTKATGIPRCLLGTCVVCDATMWDQGVLVVGNEGREFRASKSVEHKHRVGYLYRIMSKEERDESTYETLTR